MTILELCPHADCAVAWRPGVDVWTFTPQRRSAALREHWQVSQNRAAVIYAGTLSEGHGAGRLLSLELALRRTRPMHRLIVAGDGPALPELRYRCAHAEFLGRVPDSQMPELLASADLFVSPSERQSTHHAVLEAQACGLPVVVMARGAAREHAFGQRWETGLAPLFAQYRTAADLSSPVQRKPALVPGRSAPRT